MYFVDVYKVDLEPVLLQSREYDCVELFFRDYSLTIRQYGHQVRMGKVKVVCGELNLEEKVR